MWLVQPLEVSLNGKGTGRWRLTASSDEGGGGPHGDATHDHASADEAQQCTRCRKFCDGVTGMPSSRRNKWDGARPHKRPDGWPTRRDEEWLTPAERGINNAIHTVETVGASPALTEAVQLMLKARDLVADHLEDPANYAAA